MSQTQLERRHPRPEPIDPLGDIKVSRFAPPPFPKPGRRRHLVTITFLLVVALPSALGTWYYGWVASGQFATTSVVGLRTADDANAGARASGGSLVSSAAGPPASGPSSTQSYGLLSYILSASAIEDITEHGLDVRAILTRPDADFWTRIPQNAPIETLVQQLRSLVDVDYEISSGIITIQVRAFRSEDALQLADAILQSSERMLNVLAQRMLGNQVQDAEAELERAARRLAATRSAMRDFRAESGVLDLSRSLGTNADVETRLRQDITAADGQAENYRNLVGVSSPMYLAAAARGRALRAQLTELERQTERNSTTREGAAGAGVMSHYEALASDVQLATTYYAQALSQVQDARLAAARQNTYLLTFVRPGLPSRATYPARVQSAAIVVLSAFLAWAVFMLLWRAVLDHA